MSRSILVRQYLSLLDQSIADATPLFSVPIGLTNVNREDLTVFHFDSISI